MPSDDLQALKLGWKRGFGDDDEFVNYFFPHYDGDGTRRVIRTGDGDIIAQLHYFIFFDDVCEKKGCYIYGVTTLPEYRGRGIAAGMIKALLNNLREEKNVGYAVLIAEKPALREWYGTLGFVLKRHSIDVRGAVDGMNFATDEPELNLGMYYLFNPEITRFSSNIIIPQIQTSP